MFDIKEIIGSREISLVLDEGSTIKHLIDHLFERYGTELKEKIIDSKNGNMRIQFTILLDGRNINYLNGMETKLTDGSVISLLPPAGGG
jgi:molybdopterin synthase sulfur carrier subunit